MASSKTGVLKEYQVNEYITLKLMEIEGTYKTQIFVNGKSFNQCKFLLLEIPKDRLDDVNELQSIDEIAEKLDRKLEAFEGDRFGIEDPNKYEFITPEQEFWAHCSNVQVWVENNYDTRLLHANLSFPLLKKLGDLGDDKAKNMFKKELITRYSSGVPSVQRFLNSQGYMEKFTDEEMMELSLCDEHVEILKEIASETKEDVYFLFSQSNYAYKKIVGLKLHIIEHLPISLLKLKDTLNVLEIYPTHLKEISDWIGQFEKLRVLSFLDTYVSHIPKSVVKLKSLKKLSIVHSNLSDLPEYIGELRSLEELDLRKNKLSALPESIKDLSYLRILELNDNKFEEIPPQIKHLKSLESLGMVRNPLKEVPKWVFNLPSLDRIRVSRELEKKYYNINPKLKFH